MRETADAVIIGGGIVGSSVAWHLTQAGCANVLIVERESQQGKGSTGKSMGGVRAQFATDVNIRMSLYSIPIFAAFEEITGHPSEYKSHGYLFVATSPAHLEYLRRNFERQVALGLRGVEMLSRDEVIHRVPQLRSDDILGGSFCTTDGFVDPYSVMKGFMASAAEHGARLWRGVEVTGIQVDARGVAGVRTTNGDVATRTVVNAAGPWAAAVARMAGVELPIVPLRRMLVPTEPFPGLPERLPMVIDMSTGFHFRPEGLGLLMAWNDPEETSGFKMDFDPPFVEKILTHAVNRVPCFEDLQVNPHRAWAGLYAVTPDHHAIIGPAPGVPGLFFANGFSGHGVMHSPATGRITADLVLHGQSSLLDARDLNLERFAEGRMLEETAVL
ncbi:MAG TPA: FAD-dependent oxidoreductase [Bryobacteraceae bacterium]|nr:FAD-dependent oxidoreductase [Bryobacteraceae bacterium]